ncbi:unnamed protein product [Polarella glacialis]|uniref:Uncharacterized protein n=1 Tax=Polarella glacialis TaxID=89957 RepID=A0A813KQ96_POLGL|nr:unnamed protein product [Polarella glacialis]
MAPKTRGGKRAASPMKEEPPSKKLNAALKKHGVTQGSYKQVAEALTKADIPQEVREMLIAILPNSLCVASDERQEFQDVGVKMIGEVLCKFEANLMAALQAENQNVAGVEASKDGLESSLGAAEEALQAALGGTSQRTSELNLASEAVVAAQALLTKRLEEQQHGDAGLVSAQTEKETLEAALNGDFQKLKDGLWEAEPAAKAMYKALQPIIGKLPMDDSLRTAMQSTLMKEPDDRGPFDHMVVGEINKCFAAKIADLEVVLASGKPDSEARALAVAVAHSEHNAAEAAQKQASSNLIAAKELQKEATSAVKASKAALAAYQPEYQAATQLRNSKKAELETFCSDVQQIFNTLKERVSAKKLRAMAAAEAAVVAEAEAKAEAEAAAAAEAEAAAKAQAEAAAVVEADLRAQAEAAAAAQAEAAAHEAALRAQAEAAAAHEAALRYAAEAAIRAQGTVLPDLPAFQSATY